ncbi:MAG: hypothetical protein DI537_25015 [Stutzerimonas stutzeri]|nr:MAG: hypothetical protein DI537_25015 [Stutzerimonas stutzeri]
MGYSVETDGSIVPPHLRALGEVRMWQFVLSQNIRIFRLMLQAESSPVKRAILQQQLADAEAELSALNEASTPEIAQRNAALAMFAQHAIEQALTMSDAQFGCLQVHDETSGGLEIIAQKNLRLRFLRNFALVRPGDGTACARCIEDGEQIAIEDISHDLEFAPHREFALSEGFQAVVSSPLLDSGKAVGILSVHFSAPTKFASGMLIRHADHARSIGSVLGNHIQFGNDATSSLHLQRKVRHDRS